MPVKPYTQAEVNAIIIETEERMQKQIDYLRFQIDELLKRETGLTLAQTHLMATTLNARDLQDLTKEVPAKKYDSKEYRKEIVQRRKARQQK
jgi:hypothetical protein